MNVTSEQIRAYRLHAHHLNKKLPLTALETAAGACGLQNSPPGAWETALFNRIENCTLQDLHKALYQQKNLLQAWSYRGVPVVFPTGQSDIFLSPLQANDNEWPWIYTRGITAALDYLQMSFAELLPLVQNAAGYLNNHTIKSKEVLDQTLADLAANDLPADKQTLWNAPSMYGAKQTVGGAVVSFQLRPCAFAHLVVFGERQGISPTFTSFQNWTGHAPQLIPDANKQLTHKFLHCYGPATVADFADWLGSCPQQAKRLWQTAADELTTVQVENKTKYLLADDLTQLQAATITEETLLLLGAHDPYLDLKDRTIILADKSLHKAVWKTVANPGVVLKGGRIAGIWKQKLQKNKLDISITLFESLTATEQAQLQALAADYAAFRLAELRKFEIV